MRRVVLILHRWSGIVLALYIVVAGASGSALVFHDEIAATFRVPRIEPGPGAALSADAIADGLRTRYPGWHLQTLWWPESADRPWFAEVRQGAVGRIGETALAVYVHPRSGAVVHEHDYSRSVWRWLQLLHFNLLSGNEGRRINGMLAVATLFGVLTGVLIWWPRPGTRALWTIRWSTRPKRLVWELHQVAGIYLLPFFVALCLTGAYFAWRAQFHGAIERVFPMRFMNAAVQPIDASNAPPVSLASLAAAAQREASGYPVTRVIFPERPIQPIRFVVYEGTRREFYKATNLFYHPSTGELLRADRFRDRLAGDSIVHWIGAVHYGAFGGWPVKLLWVAGGLAFPLSAITGLIVWLNRRPARVPARRGVAHAPAADSH